MCRHLAYLGPPVTLADLVLHQPHSLLHQSWAPTDMRGGGTINADGFGIGWLASDLDGQRLAEGSVAEGGLAEDNRAEEYRSDGSLAEEIGARRYRRACPIWSDASLPDLAASISSAAILAAVRSATVGMPITETACAPFVEGAWMFSHNGVVRDWPDAVAPLAAGLSASELMTLEAPTDSAFVWALVRQRLREGHSALKALAAVTGDILAISPGSRLNLLLTNGEQIAATTVGHSLWIHDGQHSVTVSSEPLDPTDRRWRPVPDLSLVEATAGSYSIHPLKPIDAHKPSHTLEQGSP